MSTCSGLQVESTSRTPDRRRRRQLLFVTALTLLCLALVASVVLLTMIVVRRLQRQQHQYDVSRDGVSDDVVENSDVQDGNFPRGHVGVASSSRMNDGDPQRRRATDVRARV